MFAIAREARIERLHEKVGKGDSGTVLMKKLWSNASKWVCQYMSLNKFCFKQREMKLVYRSEEIQYSGCVAGNQQV